MKATEPLAVAPLTSLLVKLALPAVLAQLIILGYNLVDRLYIGRLDDGFVGMAALGIAAPVTTIIASLSALFGRGGAPLSAIRLGADDAPRADHILSNCLSLLLLGSFVSMVCVHIFAEDILRLLGGSGAVLTAATDYLVIYNLGTPCMLVGLGLNFFINTQGCTRIGMISPLLGGVVNIILDPLFIFGLDMGVKGAAIATVIAQMVALWWVLRFFHGPTTQLHIRLSKMLLRGELVRRISLLGAAPAFMICTEAALLICFNSQLYRFGTTADVGSMAILASLFLLVMLPMIGIVQGAQPILSYNFGAGNKQRVYETIRLALKVNTLYSFVVTTLIVLFPQFCIRLFTDEAQLVQPAAEMLRVYISGCFFLGIIITSQDTYNALGNGDLALLFAFTRKIVLLIPLIYVLPLMMEDKVFAVMLAEPVSDGISSCIALVFFIKYVREKVL